MAGRPSKYNEELGNKICALLAEGKSLRQVIKENASFPSRRAVYNWLQANEEFRAQYLSAREVQFDHLADELIEIADDGTGDWYENNEGKLVANKEHINRSRLRVDTRKWILSKLKPGQYGERTALDLGGEIKHTSGVTGDQLAEVLTILAEAGVIPQPEGDREASE